MSKLLSVSRISSAALPLVHVLTESLYCPISPFATLRLASLSSTTKTFASGAINFAIFFLPDTKPLRMLLCEITTKSSVLSVSITELKSSTF